LVAYGYLITTPSSPWIGLLTLGYVASMATKLSDTSASEVGKAYGRTTYLITTLQPVPRGTEGAVSLEGTIAGIVGSLLLSVLAWVLGMIPAIGIVIGATLQEKIDWLSNELVNFINTAIGAAVAILLGWWLLS
jgi:uncharacterized protein (TIGR00297 family)